MLLSFVCLFVFELITMSVFWLLKSQILIRKGGITLLQYSITSPHYAYDLHCLWHERLMEVFLLDQTYQLNVLIPVTLTNARQKYWHLGFESCNLWVQTAVFISGSWLFWSNKLKWNLTNFKVSPCWIQLSKTTFTIFFPGKF